jgi:multiple sugar transport system ATP-binding protein
MTTITFEGVTKVFRDGTVAVEDLDLVVDEGELFVFLGPSGSGKTTLLRLVAGLDRATEGRIYLDDEDVTDLPPPKRDVAMVFQHLALYPHMTVYDNLAFGLSSRKLKKDVIDARVRRTAALLGLEPLLRKGPKSLSGGEAQRVALGRAIVREPRAFLMDEPLSSLDDRLRLELRAELARIQRELGVTTLYVTHDQSEAMALGERVAVLRDGVIEQVHSPKRIYDRPDNLFVAGFVGSPPMNLAEATLDGSQGGGFAVIFGGHRLPVDVETARRRPRLEEYVHRQVVIGVRPEHLQDASRSEVPPGERLRARVTDRETIGPDTYVRFVVDAPLLLEVAPWDGPDDSGDGSWPAERANVWMARLASSDAGVPDEVELTIEPGRLHVFDPRTGDAIGD